MAAQCYTCYTQEMKFVRPTRGMILILVLFFVMIVTLLANAILINGPGMARMSNRANDGVLAEVAAEAGASYARLQLRSDPEWKGNKNTVTVNTPDLIIVEDNGNVVGWLSGGVNSEASMFRIRFNFQDGSGGPDGLDDPGTYPINNTYLSVNNMKSSADTVVPDINPNTYTVDDPVAGDLMVPKGSAMIRVEGWAGDALSASTGPLVAPPPGHLSSSVLRVVFTQSIDPTIPDAALSAGNGILSEMATPTKVSVIGAGTAKLRSKQGVNIADHTGADNVLDMTGQVGRSDAGGLHALQSGILETTEEVGDGNDFANLAWSDVPVASSNASTDVQIPGGVYCVDNTGQWSYYDMDLASFKALTPDPVTSVRPGGQPLSPDFTEVRGANSAIGGLTADPVTRTVIASKNVNVNASASGVDELVMCNLSGRPMVKGETAATSPYLFDGPAVPRTTPMANFVLDNAILSAKGDVTLLVNMTGNNGSITTEGDAAISATNIRMQMTGTKQRLSIYAQEDLKISTYLSTSGVSIPPIYAYIPTPPLGFPRHTLVFPGMNLPAYDGYCDLNLEGLLYAWGDADILCGTPGQPNTFHDITIGTNTISIPEHRSINIKGALVAYGGSPENFDPTAPPNSATGPGSAGTGRINMYGYGANIEYDRTKLANPAAPPNPGIPVERRAYLQEK